MRHDLICASIMEVVDHTDAELLAAAAAGDGDAFAAFFRRHVRAVTAYAVRRCSSPDEVSDLVSDTFAAALQATSRYEPMLPSALPWLFGIERRVLARQRRRRHGSKRLIEKIGGSIPRFAGTEEDDIASAIDASRTSTALQAALDRLTASERDVLELVAYDGLTPREVAIVLDVTPNAARLRLSRARRNMREMLQDPSLIEEAPHAV